MAKFTVSLLALIALVASAAAAEILNHPSGCRDEIEQQRLSSCRQYLRDGSRFDARAQNEGGGWREAFPQCCEELEGINRQCRCEAVKQVVMEHQRAGELQGKEMREMLQTARSLPSLCRISSHYCENIRGESDMF